MFSILFPFMLFYMWISFSSLFRNFLNCEIRFEIRFFTVLIAARSTAIKRQANRLTAQITALMKYFEYDSEAESHIWNLEFSYHNKNFHIGNMKFISCFRYENFYSILRIMKFLSVVILRFPESCNKYALGKEQFV
jgi:hypothetical protein